MGIGGRGNLSRRAAVKAMNDTAEAYANAEVPMRIVVDDPMMLKPQAGSLPRRRQLKVKRPKGVFRSFR